MKNDTSENDAKLAAKFPHKGFNEVIAEELENPEIIMNTEAEGLQRNEIEVYEKALSDQILNIFYSNRQTPFRFQKFVSMCVYIYKFKL